MADTVPTEADALYEIPPAEFVAARDNLARSLRAQGDKALATTVAALRRPSPAAYALNQVARSEPALVQAAMEAGEALRSANDAAAAGNASDLRAASTADRRATSEVVAAAASVLGGKGQDVSQQLAATVRAAALLPEVADELRAGVLTSHHDAPGFGFGLDAGTGELAPARKAAPSRAPSRSAKKAKPGKQAKSGKQARAAEAKAADKAADRAAAEEEQARQRTRRRAVAEQRRVVARLDATAARLAERAERAESEAATVRVAADAAEAELADAQDRLSELEG